MRQFWVPRESVERGQSIIRFGMAAVKNVGSGSIASIVEARQEGGLFESPLDFFMDPHPGCGRNDTTFYVRVDRHAKRCMPF